MQTLDDENAKPGGAIADTIWHSEHETLFDYLGSEITAIKQALAQTEQEPPKYSFKAHWEKDGRIGVVGAVVRPDGGVHLLQDFIDPPQRKPLTNGEIYTAYITATNQTLRAQDERLAFTFARAIEAAHGIKE